MMGQGRNFAHGRKDKYFDTLAFQIGNQSIQRQSDAILDVIVGTCNQHEAEPALATVRALRHRQLRSQRFIPPVNVVRLKPLRTLKGIH